MMRSRFNSRRLRESTEGPTVTVSIPREWAEELMRSLMTSLEIEDMGGEPDEDEPHMEPDEDDLPGGMSDDDADDQLAADMDDDGMFDVPAGDDDEEDDDEDPEEALDFSRGPSDGFRAGTAFGEAARRLESRRPRRR